MLFVSRQVYCVVTYCVDVEYGISEHFTVVLGVFLFECHRGGR